MTIPPGRRPDKNPENLFMMNLSGRRPDSAQACLAQGELCEAQRDPGYRVLHKPQAL